MNHWRFLSLLLVLLVIVPVLGQEDPIEEGKKLLGQWVVQKAEKDGKASEVYKGVIYEFKDGKMVMTPADKNASSRTATYSVLAPEAKGKHMRIKFTPADGPNKDEEMTGVFRIKDGMLDLCHCHMMIQVKGFPPTDFITKPDSGWILLTFKKKE